MLQCNSCKRDPHVGACKSTFDPTKKVTTKRGDPVRVLCTDRKGNYPLIVLVTTGGQELLRTYKADGESEMARPDCYLVNPKVKKWHWVYQQVYPWASSGGCSLRITDAKLTESESRSLSGHIIGRIEESEEEFNA